MTSHLKPALKVYSIAGGAAGNHTVTGISVNDYLLQVFEVTTSAVFTDLTSEFSITAADTINNTGGTATTGDQLFILVWEADPRGADLNRS